MNIRTVVRAGVSREEMYRNRKKGGEGLIISIQFEGIGFPLCFILQGVFIYNSLLQNDLQRATYWEIQSKEKIMCWVVF